MKAARRRRGRGLDCCMRIIAQWTFRVWDAGIDGESNGSLENRPIRRARHAIVLSDSPPPSNSTHRENPAGEAALTGNALTIRPGIPLRHCAQRDTPP
jgi:hypothetical protein